MHCIVGDDGPGWSTTWKALLWAHLHNSEHAYCMIKHFIVLVEPDHGFGFEGGLFSNLFTAHPLFQIDANFGQGQSLCNNCKHLWSVYLINFLFLGKEGVVLLLQKQLSYHETLGWISISILRLQHLFNEFFFLYSSN